MRIKSIIAPLACAVLLVAAALGGAGCTPQDKENLRNADGAAAAGASDGLYNVDFVLDYTPNTNHTGIYVAQALGYYAEEGLEVTVIQPPEDGADAMVASGQAQLGMSYQDVMANYLGSSAPLPVTAVAAVIQHNTSGIISSADDGIEGPADLQGKRYGTWGQDVEQAIVRSVVESDGGDFSEVVLIPSGTADEVSGLRTDMFDAIWCYEGWGLQNAYIQELPVGYFSFRSIDETFDFYTPVIIANDAFLESDPDKVRCFLAATERGYLYAAQHPEEAAQILVDAVPELDSELVLASQKMLADEYVADAPQWGYIDAQRWNAFYEWMNEQGLTESPIQLDYAFTDEYLPKK